MKTNSIIIRYIAALLLLIGVNVRFPFTASAETLFGADIHYRDSLHSCILETGSLRMSCFLAYPIGRMDVNPLFGRNAQELSALNRFLQYALGDTLTSVRQIFITGYCSIDGSGEVNERISLQRVYGVRDYLDATHNLSGKYSVKISSAGADWMTFRHLIESSPYLWRKKALRIIGSAEAPEVKKIKIAALGDGDALRRMYEDIHPLLRRVEIVITYDVQCSKPQISDIEFPLPSVYQLKSREENISFKKKYAPLFAIKTNLLFDLALIPNLELEIPLGRRWSLNAEAMLPWWLIDGDKYCLQILSGGVEARYWLGNRLHRSLLAGHFVGLYVGGGKYDLQWREKGYQGEFFIASGLSYGYTLSLSRHWNMEFSLGVGVLRTNYRYYRTRDNYQTLLWQNDGTYTWVGPTKAKISLMWLIGNKKGGRK